MMRRTVLLLGLVSSVATAQTTQGLIAGRVVDSLTGAPIPGAQVEYQSLATNTTGVAASNNAGFYVAPLLPPGRYRLRVNADRYQAQEVQELELAVAARLDLNFQLRPLSDVWEAGQYRSVFLPNSEAIVTFYGPDVDTSRSGSFEATKGNRGALETSVSQVIEPALVRDLPFAGRDVYTMLVTQPGVTADTATARGLGLSINGQRPSASNFLLDGLENNNYLVTGPLTALAPEAVQEYRVSTSNFSAEYGRTSGFIANAVTRSGGSAWHGIAYFNLKNEALNANGFQQNRQGLSRPPQKEWEPGFHAGGPILRNKLFTSSALDYLRSRGSADPIELTLPTTVFRQFTAPNSLARRLLDQYPAPSVTDRNLPTAKLSLSPPASLDRYLALQRVDYVFPGGKHRVMGRLIVARLGRPEFIWSPYKDFITGLDQKTEGVAVTVQSTLRSSLTNEARLGWSRDLLQWDRAHPEIPTLFDGLEGTVLPGSQAFYAYRNKSRNIEFVDNVLWARGSHIFKFGGGFLLRDLTGALTAGRDGLYLFQDIVDFTLDRPTFLIAPLDRTKLPDYTVPNYERQYGYNQFFFFAQDTMRVTPRLVLNFGVRYESFGSPSNRGGVKDGRLALGTGADFGRQLVGSRVVFPAGGDEELYGADHNDFAARFGFSYDLLGKGRTLLRGAYGTFYDRPFDNLWQNLRNNSFLLSTFFLPDPTTNYLAPLNDRLRALRGETFASDFPNITLVEAKLRNAYSQSYLLGLQHQLTENWALELNALGSLGRKLVTTDIVNRQGSVPTTDTNFSGRYNPDLPDVSYRANQGLSNYHALTAVARYRAARSQFQLAYTWSHAIDNQSEPLAGDFFDLSFTRITAGAGRSGQAAFTRQFDSRIDRGNSDFDQRHNLVFFSLWDIPSVLSSSRAGVLFRGWKFSQIAAFRSGFAYSVFGANQLAAGQALTLNNRADLANPSTARVDSAALGGRKLLNADAFRDATPGAVGTSGRNAFGGPGIYNVDLSIARSFPLRWLGESGRLTFRADVFNFLNHANLNNPDASLGSPDFGVALFGRRGRDSGFPALTPFNETARQFQLIMRLEF